VYPYSTALEEFTGPDSPVMDFIFTVYEEEFGFSDAVDTLPRQARDRGL
jgi:hypothetical protein